MAASERGSNRNLVDLDELEDFKVADEDPDPRGWDIVARDGLRIGEVDKLIVDTGAMKVRYLDCDLDEEALGLEPRDRHVLIPVGHARIDEDMRRVTVDAIASTDVPNLPPFTGDLSEDYDERFASLGMRGGIAGEGPRQPGEVRDGESRPGESRPGEVRVSGSRRPEEREGIRRRDDDRLVE